MIDYRPLAHQLLPPRKTSAIWLYHCQFIMGYYYWPIIYTLYKCKPRKNTPLNGQEVTGNVNHQRVDSEILLPMATFSTYNLMESSVRWRFFLPPNETHGFCQTQRIWFPQSSAYVFPNYVFHNYIFQKPTPTSWIRIYDSSRSKLIGLVIVCST